jgi:hypothetical protein
VEKRRQILLYGNSVILGSVGASMRQFSRFEVTTLATPPKDLKELAAVKPDILIFDLEMTSAESVFSFMEINPNLLLIGISPDTNFVKIWSGRQLRDVSTQGLLEVINNSVKGELIF